MPNSTWCATSHSYWCAPAVTLAFHVSDWPGLSSAPAWKPSRSKLCTSAPLFLITNCVQPAGKLALSSTKRYSSMLTLTVVLGVVHDVPPPPPPVVVVVVVVVMVFATPTPNLPVMPSLAWPDTVQMKVSLPFFLKTTLIDFVLPGAISGVFLPLILKS